MSLPAHAFQPAPASSAQRRRVALIVDGHGWASRAVVNSLGAAGWQVLAPYGTKSSRSRFCSASFRLPDYRRDVTAFLAQLSALLGRWRVDLVVPGEDASVALLYETVGLLGGASVLGGDRESARLALDKARTLCRASELGFGIPRTVFASDVEEAVARSDEVGFPCVVKPCRSYARAGNTVCSARLRFVHSASGLRQALSDYLSLGFALPLVQEWVPGRSIGVAAVLSQGRILGWGAREAFSQFPTRGGSAVWRATVGPQEPGVLQALALLQQLRFEGLGDVQYHIDRDGRPRLMEIGARTYGWLPLTIAAGADLPRIAADALGGHQPDQPAVARPGLHMRWLRGEGARIAEMLRPGAELPPGASRLDVLRQLYPLCGADMLYDGWTVSDRRLRWRR
ncbi:MAG TPA: ATP-grasp domain-containing protein [Solirubrobacteraceae bacterium]|jgi:predicted ATP-grasp superfamily ATP-dependent carboligase|nr:ATP-grasp domain-containing protein [Solirubrobacteraceae bacterium]